jgi:hypothetical protein
MYFRTVIENTSSGIYKAVSGSGCIHLHLRDLLRSLTTTGDVLKLADPFTDNKRVWMMYSRCGVRDDRVIVSLCWRKRGGRTEVLSDIYRATRSGLRRLLNVIGGAERRCNRTLGIDGGRQSKEKYGSNE